MQRPRLEMVQHQGSPTFVSRSTPIPPRSPERQALADAIERERAAQTEVDRIIAAADRIEASWTIEGRAVALQEQLAEARAGEPGRLVAMLLDGVTISSPVAALEEQIAELDRKAATARQMRKLLDERRKEAESDLHWARRKREDAVCAVLAASPAIGRLLQEHDAAIQHLADLGRILMAFPSDAHPDRASLITYFQMPGRGQFAPDTGSAAPWREAIEALATDADATLPAIPE